MTKQEKYMNSEQIEGQTDVQVIRDYLLPAQLFERVVELLGFANEFAELKMLNLQLVSVEADKEHQFPPALVVEAGGVTHAQRHQKVVQERKDYFTAMGCDEHGLPLKKND